MAKETCPHCGAAAAPGALRCAVCGASLAETELERTDPRLPAPAPIPASAPAPSPPAAVYAPPAIAGVYGYPAPGYAAGYPAVGYPGYAPYAYQPYYGYYGYYPPFYPVTPKRAPGEIYAIVIASIVTGFSALSIIAGLIACVLALFAVFGGSGNDLSVLGGILGYTLGPVIAGGFGLWYGIIGIVRRPSPRFQLPPAWMMLGLVALALGGAMLLWNVDHYLGRAPGGAIEVLPLAFLTGALPALTILAFTSQRLKNLSTRRRVWTSLLYGATLAPLLAVILEGVATLVIIFALGLNSADTQALQSQSTGGQMSPKLALATFLVLSVVAPLVEEGVKPLGALLAIRRLRTPGEAFLVGLAAGIGFDMFETIGYIGMGQADWVTIAVERIGAGLLHGVGAGMGALFWYYLINGKGVRLRWLRAAGAILYAIFQHGFFNGLALLGQVAPSGMMDWLQKPFFLGALPLDRMNLIFMFLYALILTMLIFMTHRLLRAHGMPDRPQSAPQWPAGAPYIPYPYIPWGYGLAPQPPMIPQAPVTTGGAQ
ncbi:MAG TPA: PrsW family glutamic-type intramembrane protease [Ktedonobacterales bacterium]